MYPRFGLVLMVNHACNLRCTYCYTGAKFNRKMSEAMGKKAIDRALASLQSSGILELGFFGGEPLIESELILSLIAHARKKTGEMGAKLSLGLTTNGTITHPMAWRVMGLLKIDLVISCDGLPRVHDLHRRTTDGQGSSSEVFATIKKLKEIGKNFRVNMVVCPDNVFDLRESLEYLHSSGIRQIDLSLDLWAHWQREDSRRLETAVSRCGKYWRDHLPDFGVNWFNEKLLLMSPVIREETARCGFGNGEIAVAPSGNLYPCERLIGEDGPENPMRLPGNVWAGENFLDFPQAAGRSHPACNACSIQTLCGAVCRCSNYVRTGKTTQPDGLLCLLNEVCFREAKRLLEKNNETSKNEEEIRI